MQVWWIMGASGLAVAAMLWAIVQAVRSSPLQRRLFGLFVALSWIPVLGVLGLDWRLTRRAHELVESPGLHRALESSLELARDALDRERARASELAIRWAAAWPQLPEVGPGQGWLVRTPTGPQAGGPLAQILAGVEPGVSRLDRDGTTYLLEEVGLAGETTLRVALALDPGLVARLSAVEDGSAGLRQMRLFYARFLRLDILVLSSLLTAGVLLVSLVLSRRLARQIAGPIRELSLATARVAAGDLDHRVEVAAVDEVGQLVDAFNRMTEDLRHSKQELQRTERIAAWQGVARRLAHEIKNPLTPIHLSIHRVRSKSEDPTVLECLDTMLEETENLRRLAEEFSTYGRMPEPHPAVVSPRAILTRVVDLYLRRSAIGVDWSDFQCDDPVLADEGQLRQVLANIVKNAHEAMGDRGALRLRSSRRGARVRIEVEDQGPGLPDEAEQVFAADYTTKTSGTGLGLAISRKIIEDQGGELTAHPAAQGGAVFVLELPAAEETA